MRRRQIANQRYDEYVSQSLGGVSVVKHEIKQPFPLERVKPDNKMVTCPKCLKEFKPTGIKRHLSSCRAGLVAPLAD